MDLNLSIPKPTRYSIEQGVVTYRGTEYTFWAELDLLNDEFVLEFKTDEPFDDFDLSALYEQVEIYIRTHLEELK